MHPFLKHIFLFSTLLCVVFSWSIEGPSEDVPPTQLRSAHEAHVFRQRLLSAFRQVDPNVRDTVLNSFQRYYRIPNAA